MYQLPEHHAEYHFNALSIATAGFRPHSIIASRQTENDKYLPQNVKPAFQIGDKVTHKAFVDSHGKYHYVSVGLTVVEITLIESGYLYPYYRIKAVGPNGHGYHSAAERFFDSAHETVNNSALYQKMQDHGDMNSGTFSEVK